MLTLTAARGASAWAGGLQLAALAFITVAGYLLVCLVWPYAACRRCKGDGKRRSTSRRTWRTCRRCAGTGQRRRVGTVLLLAARSKGKHR